MNYKLNDDHSVTKCTTEELIKELDDTYKTDKRTLGKDIINGALISTVFLGIDHNFTNDGPPLIFETMVFYDSNSEDEQERYSTYDEAMAGHKKYVKKYSSFQMKIRMYITAIFNL